MKKRILFFGICLLLISFQLKAQHFDDPALTFRKISSIPLQTLKGKETFIQKSNVSLYLFVFLSPECPLCKNYSTVLNTIEKKYGNKLQVYGLVPGATYTQKDLQTFSNDYKIAFPLLIDRQKAFSNYVQATVTPEVVLTDKVGTVVYRGAIDDWVQELGKKKIKPQQHYLVEAIEQYLLGEPVLVKQTTPKGCLINEF